MNYPLIEKWLGLEVGSRMTLGGKIASDHISADELEAKLAEGFEVYRNELNYVSLDKDWQVALAIGKQPIKKKTREEAALELLKEMLEDKHLDLQGLEHNYIIEIKKILES